MQALNACVAPTGELLISLGIACKAFGGLIIPLRLTGTHPSLTLDRSLPAGWYEARCVKDMRVENGQRQWLVAWKGSDAAGYAFKDSWEPTDGLITGDSDVRIIFSMYKD